MMWKLRRYILARCVLVPILLEDEEPSIEEKLSADEEAMNLIKFNVSFVLINAVLRNESFPYALRLNTMRLLFSVFKGKFIKVCLDVMKHKTLFHIIFPFISLTPFMQKWHNS